MYHALTSKCLQVFCGHEADVTCGDFTMDGKLAVSAGADGTVRVWAPRTGLSKHVFRLGDNTGGGEASYGGQQPATTCMDISPTLVLVGSEDGNAYLFHVGNKKVVAVLQHAKDDSSVMKTGGTDDESMIDTSLRSVEAVGFFKGVGDSQYNWCATGGVDGVLKVWDLGNNGQCRQVCVPSAIVVDPEKEKESPNDAEGFKSGGITKLQWHPNLPLIFTSSTDGVVRLWDARTGSLLQSFTGGNMETINSLDVYFDASKNNNECILATGSDDGVIRLFRIDIGAAVSS